MSEKKYYCYCESDCRYETMTREQILTAIMQAVNEGTISNIDAGFVQTIKTINGAALKFFVGEQSEYEALSEEEKQGLFAIITNDTTKEGIEQCLDSLAKRVGDLEEKNSTSHASTADEANYASTAGKLRDLGNAADNVARHVWFSDSEVSGQPRKDDDFKYNPSTNTLFVPNISLENDVLCSDEACTLMVGEEVSTGIVLPNGKTYKDITMIQIINTNESNQTSFVGFRKPEDEIVNFNLTGMRASTYNTSMYMVGCSFDINSQNVLKIYTHWCKGITADLSNTKIGYVNWDTANDGIGNSVLSGYVVLHLR